jgi:hypothetical protein
LQKIPRPSTYVDENPWHQEWISVFDYSHTKPNSRRSRDYTQEKKEKNSTMVVAQSNKPESLGRYVGLNENGGQESAVNSEALQRVIAVKLAAQGFSNAQGKDDELMEVASDLFRVYREQSRLLESYLPPIDQRIQAFLNDALGSTGDDIPQLPHQTLNVDRYGLARELSFPQGAQEFHSSEVCETTLN